ncbi:putative HlyD family secretion protein [Methylobacterium sp. 4-46]|uniref:efflux RND transporter periplasmic adaptor subunit n=1 Tax=unclassified Methylobacterium TaxID=2615210 RepID=UPI000152E15E|nr:MULTISPECIES: HlyD family efflux transporter periplasmic adaptor subunit [Methylobacterium]ACA15457.1 putative HlyD family secretion protein [Methylobacterium sp. 4-46]WFT81174.1 efflux RND transporter periplasmic adaptor subunit [Methylobacterium nodulans]
MRPDRDTALRPRPARAPEALGRAALLTLALIGPPGLARAEDAPTDTVRARRACFSDNVRVTGYLMPRRPAYVSINIEGYRVSDVLVQEGDPVSAGQELARVAKIGADDSVAQMLAPSNLAKLPNSISLKASAAGTVTRSTAKVGQLVSPQMDPLFQIALDRDLDLMVQVPSLYISKIRAGAESRILIGNDLALRGEVRMAATDVDPATQFGRAFVSVPAHADLRPGMFARALIDTARSCGIAVPRAAILRRSDTTSVQVVRGGRIETRRVVVGSSSEDDVEIRSGVGEGDTVVAKAGTAF